MIAELLIDMVLMEQPRALQPLKRSSAQFLQINGLLCFVAGDTSPLYYTGSRHSECSLHKASLSSFKKVLETGE